ncbi:hypothetical protein BDV29DRAFT_201330 [Aspergillus leporis]|uniref:AA1-like domain-containing protein n=1 Tax=Aspergillus leporis TaxID=41062 RepID=A0A5N5X139_9EURO|nr:hypothetical protein BDV29DRAFT_201330 [Aspergillus leporis]
MQLSSVFAVALSVLSLVSALPLHRLSVSPALVWHVADFSTGCSPGGCVYNFNITGVASQNTPGFHTHCSGTNVQKDFVFCDDKHVKAKVVTQLYPAWTVEVQHAWFHGQAEFYASGRANVTSTLKNFTIPVTEVYGVA